MFRLPNCVSPTWWHAPERAVNNLEFTADELAQIDKYADEEQINLWAASAEQDA